MYFTDKTEEDFEKKHPDLQLDDLENKYILITDWSMELFSLDEPESDRNLECSLIVHQLTPIPD